MKRISVLWVVGFLSCVTTPESGRLRLAPLPDAIVNPMGVQAYAEAKQQEKKSTNKALRDQVFKVARGIADASGAGFKWEFELFDNDKVVNAWCLPGGKIGIYTGILPLAKNTAGLAAVLGHEVAHAVARHGGERMSQNFAVQGLAVGAATMTDEKYRGPVLAALSLGAQYGVLLPYSRAHESEADDIGLKYMAKAGYQLKEAPALWRRMAQLGNTPPEVLSTHPDPMRRAKDLEKLIPKYRPIYKNSSKQKTEALKI